MAASSKYLVGNILDVTHCGSRFCPGPAISPSRNSAETKILARLAKETVVWNVGLTPMLSIFCPQNIEPVRLCRDFPLTR